MLALYTELGTAEGVLLANEPSGAFNPREDEGIHIGYVIVSGGAPASYEALRQTLSEKLAGDGG